MQAKTSLVSAPSAPRPLAADEVLQLASAISHDLGEPLRKTGSFAVLLERRLGSRLLPEEREFLGYITDGARRAQTMVQDLARYLRLPAALDKPQTIPLAVLVDDAQRRVLNEIQEAHADVGVIASGSLVGDKDLLADLLTELLANALRFRSLAGPVRIAIEGHGTGSDWTLQVSDNGPGIAPADRERVFNPFVRLAAPGPGAGSGMGLAYCRAIAGLHRATIRAEANPGGGCRIVVEKSSGGAR